jgi:hypothetical protein
MPFAGRLIISVVLTICGGTIGALVGISSSESGVDALYGALIGFGLSWIDFIFVGGITLIFALGFLAAIIAGTYELVQNPWGWLRIFAFIGTLSALLGFAIGSTESRRSRGMALGLLIGITAGAFFTTLIVGVVSGGNAPEHIHTSEPIER